MDKVTSHWDLAKEKIISQYWDAAKWQACLKAVIDKYDMIENEAWDLAGATDFMGLLSDVPTGLRLDFVGGIVGLERISGETDAAYYARILEYVDIKRSATIEGILTTAKSITGDAAPILTEENFGFPFSASSVLLTLSERQLTRSEANRIKPAGSRLFVGGLIKSVSGTNFLSTVSGKKIMAVGGPYEVVKVQNFYDVLDVGISLGIGIQLSDDLDMDSNALGINVSIALEAV